MVLDGLAWMVDVVAGMLARAIPYANFHEYVFLQRALLGLVLLAPLTATMGLQVVSFRLSFFSEAVGHSIFTGVAIGYLCSLAIPAWGSAYQSLWIDLATVGFGVLVALVVTYYRRSSTLASDTVIGVFSATVVSIGLMVIGYLIQRGLIAPQNIFQSFVAGNILTVEPIHLAALAGFFLVVMLFHALAYNRMLLVSLNPELAETRGVPAGKLEYLFSALLAVLVIFSIRSVGVLLVTALLVIPAASARNLARSAGQLFWVAIGLSLSACVIGLILSDCFGTYTGATIIAVMATLFVASESLTYWRGR
jgi:zinc transport system permease protein